MKTIILIFAFLYPLVGFAQFSGTDELTFPLTEAQRDSILVRLLEYVESVDQSTSPPPLYKLYKTENIYTLLKLNTATGEIDQLQWTLNQKNEGTMPINEVNLSFLLEIPGTFELYPTGNMYQFILLDTRLGRTWHVQWGIGDKNRWIRRID